MRIVPIISITILMLAPTSAFARRSRCPPLDCECAPCVCSIAARCAKPTTACCTPQPTVIALQDQTVPIAATNQTLTDEKAASEKRPKPQRLDDADAKLDAYLADWEKASSKIRRLDCEFLKIVYDPNFEIERRGRGTIAVERDGPARYRVIPVAINSGDVSKKKSKTGTTYELRSCSAECWHWTGSQLLKFVDQVRSYETIDLNSGAELNSSGFFEIVWPRELPFAKPFLLGMPAGQIKKRFKVRVLKESDKELFLEFIPRSAVDSGNWQRAVLILDRREWLPRAFKVFDPTGGETVHVFQNVKVNSAERGDLSKPSLEGYRQVKLNLQSKAETSK